METVVKSYIRHKKIKVTPKQDLKLLYILVGSAIILFAIVYYVITLSVLGSLGALYGLKTIMRQEDAVAIVEASKESEVKPKRPYNRRMKINHYQLGKVSA